MRIGIWQVDAFASRPFAGNPAAVCPLVAWLPERLMQQIAAETNLSETAFIVKGPSGWEIRWFTPVREIDLCGHATLASAWVVFHKLDGRLKSVTFSSKSGPLTVERNGETLSLDFPARPGEHVSPPPELAEALGRAPAEVLKARDLMAVYLTEDEVRALHPDFGKLHRLDAHAVIATAPGKQCDFVSRFFAPRSGIQEDPVTGSSHCTLIPYWSRRLRKREMRAVQVSPRGGELLLEDRGDRVAIAGRAVPVLEGILMVDGA
jgi:PhzF family phenazine biosynthesis protein